MPNRLIRSSLAMVIVFSTSSLVFPQDGSSTDPARKAEEAKTTQDSNAGGNTDEDSDDKDAESRLRNQLPDFPGPTAESKKREAQSTDPEVKERIYQRELTKLKYIQQLIPAQQVEWAERIIQQFPGTPLAEKSESILDDYQILLSVRQQVQERQRRRTQKIREYWTTLDADARRVNSALERARASQAIRLVNPGTVSVMYDVRQSGHHWTGPYRLPFFSPVEDSLMGSTDHGRNEQVFYHSVDVRVVVSGRIQTYSLHSPGRYEFVFEEGSIAPVHLIRSN